MDNMIELDEVEELKQSVIAFLFIDEILKCWLLQKFVTKE